MDYESTIQRHTSCKVHVQFLFLSVPSQLLITRLTFPLHALREHSCDLLAHRNSQSARKPKASSLSWVLCRKHEWKIKRGLMEGELA